MIARKPAGGRRDRNPTARRQSRRRPAAVSDDRPGGRRRRRAGEEPLVAEAISASTTSPRSICAWPGSSRPRKCPRPRSCSSSRCRWAATSSGTVFAGIKSAYEPASLVGRLVICVANLAPRQMKFGIAKAWSSPPGPAGRRSICSAPTAARCRGSGCTEAPGTRRWPNDSAGTGLSDTASTRALGGALRLASTGRSSPSSSPAISTGDMLRRGSSSAGSGSSVSWRPSAAI